MKKVYLDYAATTPVDPRVLKAMLPYFSQDFGNPSSVHSWGQATRRAIEQAREEIAEILKVSPREIYFTPTTTSSNNLAIQGVVKAAKKRNKQGNIVTSAIEHHAVLDTVQKMAREGLEARILPVDKNGLVSLDQLKKNLDKNTLLVSIMLANNEVGTIQPIPEIARITKPINNRQSTTNNYPYFHTDAATVVDYLELDVKKLGVDLMTLGSHKFGGPKGIGLLYIRDGVEIEPIIYGGHHERSMWPGTEPVPLIIGMTEAMKIAVSERDKAAKEVSRLRDRLTKGVLTGVSDSELTGHPTERLPDIASFLFKGVEGEAVLLALDQKGIAASSGSACTSGGLKPSHVLLSMGIPPERAHGSIRFSLGKKTTEEEIDYVLEVLPGVIKRLREMAPKI